ncbi:hypothetical protein GCM10010306_090730 [Streptomyces umbrinus]|uniref:hypothetical protein n=1 Tax=Streptomyces umbrinus TaxID=67370 RepID=UPI00167320B4|nr:hypothetical protein [Streptomyces umbrinus]GHB82075.1 hypothetical protein GCM10010306_090730 [Streptomyces umbrinus]
MDRRDRFGVPADEINYQRFNLVRLLRASVTAWAPPTLSASEWDRWSATANAAPVSCGHHVPAAVNCAPTRDAQATVQVSAPKVPARPPRSVAAGLSPVNTVEPFAATVTIEKSGLNGPEVGVEPLLAVCCGGSQLPGGATT